MTAGFLLDTNVLPELMRPVPAPTVLAWFDRYRGRENYTSSITQAEILTGIALLPQGKRHDALAAAAHALFEQDLAGQCLPFASAAAARFARVVAQRVRAGRPITTEDAQIAAIALTAGLVLVTRNTKDFADIDGLNVVNPWGVAQ